MIKVLIVDDHPLIREGVKAILDRTPGFRVVGEASDGREVIQKVEDLTPDVVLMDINMPYGGIPATIEIMRQFPETKILMLTISDKDDDLLLAVKAGARGYLLKGGELEELISALRLVAEGGAIFTPLMASKLIDEFRAVSHESIEDTRLTSREQEVLVMVADGASNKEIATALYLSEPTIKAHLRNILSKLHLKNRSQAAVYASEHDLVHKVGREPDGISLKIKKDIKH